MTENTHSVLEVAGLARDRKERLEHVSVQLTSGVLGRLVGHKAVDEGVCSRLDNHTREGPVEEVGVLGDTLLESRRSEVGQ